MSLNHKHQKRKSSSKKQETFDQISEGFFFGLEFITKVSDIIDTQESFTTNPNIIIKDDNIIVDYGHVLFGDTNQRNKEEIKLLFDATAVAGDTFTLTDGEYLNELEGDTKIYNLSGNYTFVSFDVDSFIVIFKKVNIDNESPNYTRYNKKYFINGSIKWTTSGTTDETKVEDINEIVNLVGRNSSNSFKSVLGEILNNDIIEMKVLDSITHKFTVSNYYTDDAGIEHIEVAEHVPDEDIFAQNIFLSVNRKPQISVNIETPKKKPIKTIPQPPKLPIKSKVVNLPSPEPSPEIKSPKGTLSTNIKKEKMAIGEEKWLQSGKKTFRVSIENDKFGNPTFAINGKTDNENLDSKPIMRSGNTYRFITSHISNGSGGYTNKKNYFIIGTSPESDDNVELKNQTIRNDIPPGMRGSYLYFTVPKNATSLYFMSRDGDIKGGKIRIEIR